MSIEWNAKQRYIVNARSRGIFNPFVLRPMTLIIWKDRVPVHVFEYQANNPEQAELAQSLKISYLGRNDGGDYKSTLQYGWTTL